VLDPFYPVVPDVSWVKRLVPIGARLIQLRIKGQPADEIGRQVREARDICVLHGAEIIVNDHWQTAIDEGCAWVHLGQEDLLDADIKALRRAGLRIGVSTHDHAELDKALAVDPDYVALGPIWPTQLKQMPWAPQGTDRLGEWKRLIGKRPLVAIGGLTHDIHAAGAAEERADSEADDRMIIDEQQADFVRMGGNGHFKIEVNGVLGTHWSGIRLALDVIRISFRRMG